MSTKQSNISDVLKLVLFSLIGIFMFFIPITIGDKSTIPLDHLVTYIKGISNMGSSIFALIVIILGGAYPFYTKTWNKDVITMVFSVLKLLGIVVAFMAVFSFGPAFLFEPDMVPFLFNKLVIPVGIIVPLGALFLSFLVGYGLLEFIGVLMQPVMRPIWKTPGRSAIDAVASFVGSYSIGLLITNRVFKEGKYTVKEAAIIATGFSTVSATFMIIVAKTLGLMDIWNLFFWSTLIITFIVTAVTVRIWPLNKMPNTYFTGEGSPEPKVQGNLFIAAYNEGLKAAKESKSLMTNIVENIRDGFLMAMSILPSILSVGLLGLLLAKYTPIFDIVGYIFYPFTFILKVPEPLLTAKAMAIEIAEMFLPALLMTEAPLISRYVIAVISISSILFMSASIPCIMSTDIPLSMRDIVIIWIERTVISLILAAPVAFFLL